MKNSIVIPAIVILALILPRTTVADPPLERIEQDNSLTNEFETPHTRWARPYAGGTLRTLFISQLATNINVLPLRHSVELMQRFDVEGDAVLVIRKKGDDPHAIAFAGGSGVYGGKTGEKRLQRLLENRYDCYFVGGPIISYLPTAARKHIFDEVSRGAGMVLLHQEEDGEALLAEFEEIDDEADLLHDMKTRRFRRGKGRIALVESFPPQSSWNVYNPSSRQRIFGFDIRRDMLYEAHGRAMLWAANREPGTSLAIEVGKETIARTDLASHKVRLRWNDANGKAPRRITARIRSEGRDAQEPIIIKSIDAARGETAIALPVLTAGDYWIDAIAEGTDGITGWTIATFGVGEPQHIRKITLEREGGEAGEPIRGTVTVAGPATEGRTLRVQAVDRHGRIVSRQVFTPVPDGAAFSLPTDARMPAYLSVEAALIEDGREITRNYSVDTYTIIRRKQNQWNLLMWGRLYASQLLEVADDVLAASGVTSRMETSNVPWWFMTRAGMNYTPYCDSGLYRLLDSGPQEPMVDEDGTLTLANGCWNDEPAVSQRLRKSLGSERDYARHGVLVYSMGDEQAVLGSCLHPSCWKIYQQWLGREYGTIEALNESWGSDYSAFDAIEPKIDETAIPWYPKRSQRVPWHLTWANNEYSSVAMTSGSSAWNESWRNYPRYIDRRSFQYWNFANYCRRFRDAARVIDPHAVAGVEGQDIYLDADIDVIVRHTGWWMPYGGENGDTTNEVIRSIAPRGYLYGHFSGGFSFWQSVLRGGNTLGKWRIDNVFTPGMQLKPGFRRLVDSGRILFDGVGSLLNGNPGSEMLDDGIVMLHSMASVKMAKIGDGPTYGIFRWRDDAGKVRSAEPRPPFHEVNRRNHRAWHRNLRASTLQFRYTTDGQIRRGEFDPASARIMILSQYEVIGPDEEKLIRKFVHDGGMLIADVRPGFYGARGKPRKGGVLDDLFGVRHRASAEAAQAPAEIEGTIGRTRLKLEQRDLFVNPAIEVTDGRALGRAGRTPICIVRETGKGRAVLLNFAMWSFPKLAVHDGPDDAVAFFRGLLATGGVAPTLELADGSGRRHRNIEAMRWRTGPGVEVLALHGPAWGTWPEPNGSHDRMPPPFEGSMDVATPVTVKLPEARYVYEMRSGRGGDRTRSFKTGVRPRVATLVVVSEHELNAPEVRAAEHKAVRGRSLPFQIRIPGARGRQALNVRAKRPAGDEASWFSQSVIAEDGKADVVLPIAFNEQTGAWTLTVMDLFTGKKDSARFEVE
ncbi:MAG: hypothetical protein CMJ18_10715 [Phycisphaeraceae bacterium]|nr:hypothetical protein [Phycisphaeraceae bacterium]